MIKYNIEDLNITEITNIELFNVYLKQEKAKAINIEN